MFLFKFYLPTNSTNVFIALHCYNLYSPICPEFSDLKFYRFVMLSVSVYGSVYLTYTYPNLVKSSSGKQFF